MMEKIGYMCKTDFEEELGNNIKGNMIYPSIEVLKKKKSCASECGIVKVIITVKEIIEEGVIL